MAQLVGVLHTSHGGFTTIPSEHWGTRRAARSYRADVPVESQAEMDAKWARTLAGIHTLRQKLAEMRPDVLVIVGDDQEECFDFNNHPSIAVFVGEQFAGRAPGAVAFEQRGTVEPELTSNPGHPGLAKHILTGLLASDFDPAFMLDLPKPRPGMAHAVMNPLGFFTDFTIPAVPVLVNAYYAPQVTAARMYRLGRAIRVLVDSYPEDLRVVVIGSGGLWHTPGQKESWLNEEFDQKGLKYLESGDIEKWAELFDAYEPGDDPSQEISIIRNGTTGLPSPSGPQFGSRETLCWIGAAAVADGSDTIVVDYVPVYASPVGNGFAYCDNPE
jgi:hypothetical protein